MIEICPSDGASRNRYGGVGDGAGAAAVATQADLKITKYAASPPTCWPRHGRAAGVPLHLGDDDVRKSGAIPCEYLQCDLSGVVLGSGSPGSARLAAATALIPVEHQPELPEADAHLPTSRPSPAAAPAAAALGTTSAEA